MFAIVGLGNPGSEYEGTRHNIGFNVVDRLKERWFPHQSWTSKFDCDYIKGRVSGTEVGEVLLVKPLKYMNLSGEASVPLLRFFKIEPEETVVVHDELAFPPGRLQVRIGGGTAGHNGISDIISRIGTQKFYRLRVGIGHPRDEGLKTSPSNWVLSRPGPKEKELLEDAVFTAAEAIETLISNGLDQAQQRFNLNPKG